MLRRWLVCGLAVGVLGSVIWAKPGSVRTMDGTSYRGDVTEDDKFVTIKDHGVSTRIDKRNVAADGIQYTASLDEQFTERHAKLAANDIKGRIELAHWATQNQRADLAVKTLEEAVKADPTNREAALQLETAQRQVDLDRRQQSTKPAVASAATRAASQPATAPVATASAGPTKAAAPEHRLLTNEEVNIIRQKELQPSDTKVRVQIAPDALKRYLSTGDRDAEAFRKMTPIEQAFELLRYNDPKLASEVRLLTDPAPLVEFKTKVYPLVATGCGSTACHGGNRAGDFHLFAGESPNVLYTNFYILQTYAKSINGTQMVMLDRALPNRSLFLQYALPASEVDTAHPQAPNFRPRFRTKSEAGYKLIQDWLTNGLTLIAPSYGIKMSAKAPASQPAATAPAAK